MAQPWDGLLDSWLLALEAQRKSPHTLDSYRTGPAQLATWLHARGLPDRVDQLTTDHLRQWLAELSATRSANTARSRYASVRQFLHWCLAEGEVDRDLLANVPQPRVPEKPAPMLTTDQVQQLLASAAGPSFADVRDRAIMLLFADTGMRLGALAGLTLEDVDLRERVAAVSTKGSRELVVPYGATTAQALDRYLRARRRQRYADRTWLWLSATGKGRLTGAGVRQMLGRRGQRLGISPLYPHMFRHTFADAWLAAGGGETDLMELVGWRSRQMVSRYGAARRAVRAREAHRRLSPMDNLGRE